MGPRSPDGEATRFPPAPDLKMTVVGAQATVVVGFITEEVASLLVPQ